MRLTKVEKEALFELLDTMTDRCPQVAIDRYCNEHYNNIFYGIFKKLRMEKLGY